MWVGYSRSKKEKIMSKFFKGGYTKFAAVLMFLMAAANTSFAAAIMDMTSAKTAITDEITAAAPAIASIVGLIMAVVIVLSLTKKAK